MFPACTPINYLFFPVFAGRCAKQLMGCIAVTTMETPFFPSPAHQNGDVSVAKLAMPALHIHIYHQERAGPELSPLTYPAGQYVAEELCINAAKECGECLCPSIVASCGFILSALATWFLGWVKKGIGVGGGLARGKIEACMFYVLCSMSVRL